MSTVEAAADNIEAVIAIPEAKQVSNGLTPLFFVNDGTAKQASVFIRSNFILARLTVHGDYQAATNSEFSGLSGDLIKDPILCD